MLGEPPYLINHSVHHDIAKADLQAGRKGEGEHKSGQSRPWGPTWDSVLKWLDVAIGTVASFLQVNSGRPFVAHEEGKASDRMLHCT